MRLSASCSRFRKKEKKKKKRTPNGVVNGLARLLHAEAEHVHVRPQLVSPVEEHERKLKVALKVQRLCLAVKALRVKERARPVSKHTMSGGPGNGKE